MAWTKYGCKGSEIFWIEQIKIAFLVRFLFRGRVDSTTLLGKESTILGTESTFLGMGSTFLETESTFLGSQY